MLPVIPTTFKRNLFILTGSERILLDFEFILGQKLSKIWILLWCIAPVILLALFAWGLATLGPYLDSTSSDSEWYYLFSWSIIVICILFVFYMGFHTVNNQEEYYTFIDVSIFKKILTTLLKVSIK